MTFLFISIRRDFPQTPKSKWTNLSVLITHTLCCFPVTMHKRPRLPFKTTLQGLALDAVPIHFSKRLLQGPLSSAFSSRSSLENSQQGKRCNTVNLKANPFLDPYLPPSNYPISLYPFRAKLPLTELSIFAACNSSLVSISIMLLSSTLQLNIMSRSLKSTKLLEGDSQMKYYLTL